jgi:hypothetical protein
VHALLLTGGLAAIGSAVGAATGNVLLLAGGGVVLTAASGVAIARLRHRRQQGRPACSATTCSPGERDMIDHV